MRLKDASSAAVMLSALASTGITGTVLASLLMNLQSTGLSLCGLQQHKVCEWPGEHDTLLAGQGCLPWPGRARCYRHGQLADEFAVHQLEPVRPAKACSNVSSTVQKMTRRRAASKKAVGFGQDGHDATVMASLLMNLQSTGLSPCGLQRHAATSAALCKR